MCRRVVASSVSMPRRSVSRRLQSSRAFKTAAWAFGSTHRRRISHRCEAYSRTARRLAPSSRPAQRGKWSMDGSLYALATKLRGADRARPDERGRGSRDPASSARGPISSRSPYARSGLARSDRTLTEQAVEALRRRWGSAGTRRRHAALEAAQSQTIVFRSEGAFSSCEAHARVATAERTVRWFQTGE